MRSPMEIKRILCPTDLSEASAHAVDHAVVMAGYYKSRITALHVLDPVIPTIDGDFTSDVNFNKERR